MFGTAEIWSAVAKRSDRGLVTSQPQNPKQRECPALQIYGDPDDGSR